MSIKPISSSPCQNNFSTESKERVQGSAPFELCGYEYTIKGSDGTVLYVGSRDFGAVTKDHFGFKFPSAFNCVVGATLYILGKVPFGDDEEIVKAKIEVKISDLLIYRQFCLIEIINLTFQSSIH